MEKIKEKVESGLMALCAIVSLTIAVNSHMELKKAEDLSRKCDSLYFMMKDTYEDTTNTGVYGDDGKLESEPYSSGNYW